MSSDNPTVSPASDAEIAAWKAHMTPHTLWTDVMDARKLFARIASEVSANRAKDETIRAQAEEIERLRKALGFIAQSEEDFNRAVDGIHSNWHALGWLKCDCATAAFIRRALADVRMARAALAPSEPV